MPKWMNDEKDNPFIDDGHVIGNTGTSEDQDYDDN